MKLPDRTCALDDGDTMRSLPSRLSDRPHPGRVGWSAGKRMHGSHWPGHPRRNEAIRQESADKAEVETDHRNNGNERYPP